MSILSRQSEKHEKQGVVHLRVITIPVRFADTLHQDQYDLEREQFPAVLAELNVFSYFDISRILAVILLP